jgi:hypothetical protein
MVNEPNIERLLTEANPVVDPEQLRLPADEIDARCTTLLERRRVMPTKTLLRQPEPETRTPPAVRKPVLAFAAGLAVVLVVVGAIALWGMGGDPDFAEEPGPITQTTTPLTQPPTTASPPATTAPATPATTEPSADGLISAPASAAFAPGWRGPLMGGGEFDLTDYRHDSGLPENGSFVVVLSWWPPPFCSAECIEQLDVMQELYAEYGQTDWFATTGGYNIEFVTVSEDTAAITTETLDQRSINVPTVYCYPEPDPITHGQPFLCVPAPSETQGLEPWPTDDDGDPVGPLWGNPIQSITLVDASGYIYGVYDGSTGADYSDLDAQLRFISGLAPDVP